MHELLAQLFAYARMMWRHRWLALALAWVIAISGWIYVARIPDEYQASARVFVDANSILRPLLQGLTIQPDLVQQVALMSRMLLSRPNLEKVASKSDLDLFVHTEREKEQLLTELGHEIRIQGDRTNASLYTVSYQHRNPEIAKKVVGSMVSIFIENALVNDQQATATAKNFLDQEIEKYEERLKKSERQLADFQRENAGLLPGGDKGGFYADLEAAQTGLKESELALREAKWRREELDYQIESQDQAFVSNFDAQTDDLTSQQMEDPRLAGLQEKLDLLLLRYTERHPDVQQLRRVIEELRTRYKHQAIARRTGKQASGDVPADTVYGSLQVALSETDTQIAAMKARVEDYSQRVKELQEKIDSIPDIQAKLKQLTRNYATISAQHKELLERRESAQLSTQVEKTSEGVKFRIIDPPFVPLKPAAPNRLVLNGAVLLLALGSGLGSTLAVNLFHPVFDDRHLLYRITGLPVFGTVSLIQSPAERHRDRIMLIPFIVMSLALLITFAIATLGSDMIRSLLSH